MTNLEIRKVENKKDFKAFFEFPWTLYKDDPNWVPPLKSIRRDLFNKDRNPAWGYMEGEYFTAWRGDKIVGTITAHINHRHNEFHGENVGWFGAFEVYDDQEAAHIMLETAAEWVRSRGYDAIRGPQITTHEECGVLIDNFTPPVLLMPYNYPYYQGLIEGEGFTKAMDVNSVYIDRELVEESGAVARIEKIVSRITRRLDLVLRPIDRKNLRTEFELFKELYNDAWAKNWGFVPMTPKELDAMVESLGQFFDPDLAYFAEVDGEPAGFMICVPNFNEVLHMAYARPGTPELWTLLKALWYWKGRRVIRGVRLPLLGVKEEHRKTGVDIALYYSAMKALLPTNYTSLDCGWILETNELLDILDKFGGKIYKTHRFYEKTF